MLRLQRRGQAAQPILSTNYGAKNAARIRQALHLALGTSMVFAAFWTGLSECFPQLYIHIFMRPSAEILSIAPAIIRRYSVSFVLLPVNIFSTYYFQSILRPKDSFIVSIARGLLVSGLLIFALPALFAPRGNLVGNASDRACDERLRCLCHAEKSDRTLCKLATCVLHFLC